MNENINKPIIENIPSATPKKYKILAAILTLVFVYIIFAILIYEEPKEETTSNVTPTIALEPTITPTPTVIEEVIISPTVNPSPTTEQAENTKLTHTELFNITQSDYTKVIGKTYLMDLYLEQQQTATQAEFMTITNPNSSENILITCNMTPSDLGKFDGEATLRRETPLYEIRVTFDTFNESLLYFTANCSLSE